MAKKREEVDRVEIEAHKTSEEKREEGGHNLKIIFGILIMIGGGSVFYTSFSKDIPFMVVGIVFLAVGYLLALWGYNKKDLL